MVLEGGRQVPSSAPPSPPPPGTPPESSSPWPRWLRSCPRRRGRPVWRCSVRRSPATRVIASPCSCERRGAAPCRSRSRRGPWRGPDGARLLLLVRDVTANGTHDELRAMQVAITRTLSMTPTFEAGAPRILEAVSRALGMLGGEAWLLDPDRAVLTRRACWWAPGVDSGVFDQARWDLDVRLGADLPGRVWATSAPVMGRAGPRPHRRPPRRWRGRRHGDHRRSRVPAALRRRRRRRHRPVRRLHARRQARGGGDHDRLRKAGGARAGAAPGRGGTARHHGPAGRGGRHRSPHRAAQPARVRPAARHHPPQALRHLRRRRRQPEADQRRIRPRGRRRAAPRRRPDDDLQPPRLGCRGRCSAATSSPR